MDVVVRSFSVDDVRVAAGSFLAYPPCFLEEFAGTCRFGDGIPVAIFAA